MADKTIKGRCNEPGPYSTHCTEWPLHHYSCYDAQDDSSWNDRSPEDWQTDTPHVCEDPTCALAEEMGIMVERRAPVNGAPHGTVSWEEHEEAWTTYHRHHREQDAEEIARRGGFGLVELTQQLGRVPGTWLPDDRTSRRYFPRGD